MVKLLEISNALFLFLSPWKSPPHKVVLICILLTFKYMYSLDLF